MIVRRPGALVTTPTATLNAAEAGLAHLKTSCSILGAHDHLLLVTWSDSKLRSLAPGDSLSVSLGEKGDEQMVWTGEVSEAWVGIDGLVIEGLAATSKLSHIWRSQTYASQTVADIINDLASDMDIDEVEGDTELDAYAVDDRVPVWDHVIDLARLVSADVGCSPDGGLRFVPQETGSAETELRYGADLIRFDVALRSERIARRIAPFGAASESGSEKWHWVLRSPTPSGKTDGPVQIVPVFRTKEPAEALAQALAERARRRTVGGQVVAVGRPEIRPGSVIALKDLPSDDWGALRVLRVSHLFDTQQGFITSLDVEGTGSGGGGGGI